MSGGGEPTRPGAPRKPFVPAGQLLWDITVRPLDPGYLQRNRNRDPGGPADPVRRTWTAIIVVGLVAVGVVVGAGAQQLRSVPAAASARQVLVSQVEQRTQLADDAAAVNAGQRAQIERLQSEALAGKDDALAGIVARLGVAAGALPVSGPGLRVTLDDAPDAEDVFADPKSSDNKRVIDFDVQQVVNGLWAGGAEAVAVNGQRLTSLSPIRGAGTAILVDNRPLARPYTIEAIGDVGAMQDQLIPKTPTGDLIAGLQSQYGIQVSVDREGTLSLPGSSAAQLAHARPYAPVAAAQDGVTAPGAATTGATAPSSGPSGTG